MVVVFCRSPAPLHYILALVFDDVGCRAQIDAVMYTAQYQPKECIGKASPLLDWFALGKTIEATVGCYYDSSRGVSSVFLVLLVIWRRCANNWCPQVSSVVGSAGSDAGALTAEADCKGASESDAKLDRDGRSLGWYQELHSLASTMLRGRHDDSEIVVAVDGFSRLASALGVVPVTA